MPASNNVSKAGLNDGLPSAPRASWFQSNASRCPT